MLSVYVKEKSYVPESIILKNIHLQIDSGEVVAITGPSGCGKTTLLNLIAGLDSDFHGEISLNGVPGDESHLMGIVFQQPRLMPWLTAIDNLLLVMTGDIERNRQICERKLTQTGLLEARDYYPSQMSGGMQRRLAMARAFVNKPSVLLLDEPFSSLDIATADKQRSLLMSLCEETNPLVLLVTHDLREAIAVSNRIIFLSASPSRVVNEHFVELNGTRNVNDPEVHEIFVQLSTQIAN